MRKPKSEKVEAENRAGLAALASLQGSAGLPAPGVATPTRRLHGRFAVMTWGGTGSILCSDWEVNFDQEFVDGTAHGEYWDVPVPIKMSWTGRVQAYMNAANIGATFPNAGWLSFMASHVAFHNAFRRTADPSRFTFTGYPGPIIASQYIFQGDAYASRAAWNAPNRGAVTQELQLRGYGPPTAGPLP